MQWLNYNGLHLAHGQKPDKEHSDYLVKIP